MAGATIKYGGKTFVLSDSPVFQGITEFITAIRQGSATRDDRNLANFFSYEDGRAGIGLQLGNVREDFDKVADHAGLIMGRQDEAIKSPLMQTKVMTGIGKAIGFAVIRELDVDGTIRLYVGYDAELWYTDGTNVSSLVETSGTKAYTGTENITDMVTYVDPVGGTKRIYVGNDGNADIVHFVDPTASGPFTAISGVKGEMLFEFDGRLWAGERGVLKYSVDPTSSFSTLASTTGAWPNRWKFIGIFRFGDTFAPYVLIHHDDQTRARIAVLNIDAGRLIPLSLGMSGIVDAKAEQSVIVISFDGGRNVAVFDPATFDRRDFDWRATDRGGFSAARTGLVSAVTSNPKGTVAVSNMDATTECQFFVFQTTGWHPYGLIVTGDAIGEAHYITHLNQMVMAVKPSGSDLQLNFIDQWDEAYTQGVDQGVLIETSDMDIETPWFALGFAELSGPLLSLSCGGFFNADNKIQVDYQVDFDPDSLSWQPLGTFPNILAPDAPEITGRGSAVEAEDTLLFDSLFGKAFTYVKFRFRLISKDANQSPNAYPMTIHFFKRPKLRESIRMGIDVRATLGLRLAAGDNVKDLSPDDVWKDLKAIYDLDTVPKLEVGPVTTWAAMIALPRVLDIGSAGSDVLDLVTRPEVSEDATIVVNAAELL